MKKRILYAGLGFGLLVVVIIFFKLRPKAGEVSQEEWPTVKVERGDVVRKIFETGVVTPKKVVNVQSEVGGRVIDIRSKVGDYVSEGDILILLDKKEILTQTKETEAALLAAKARLEALVEGSRPQEIKQAQAEAEQARVTLEDAKSELKRRKKLFEEGIISKQLLERGENDFEVAKNRLRAAKERFSLVKEGARKQDIAEARANVVRQENIYNHFLENLEKTTIRAPISGTIIQKNVEVGEVITSGTVTAYSTGTIIMVMADFSEMLVKTKINEVDIPWVEEGQKVEIRLDAIMDRVYRGHVVKAAPVGAIVEGVVNYDVVIGILDADERLKMNMTADVDIVTGEARDSLYLPPKALISKNGNTFIFLSSAKDRDMRRVETGLSNENRVVILDVVKEGDVVKIPPDNRLKP